MIRQQREELEQLRSPAGYNHFIHTIGQFNQAANELDKLNKEKWEGLVAMDHFLEEHFANSNEKDRLRAKS